MSRYVWALGVALIAFGATPLRAKELPADIQSKLDAEQYGAVIAPLTAYLEKEKKSVEGWTALGFAHYFLEEDDAARDAFKQALDLKKKSWPALHGLVRTLTRLGDFTDAEEKVRWSIKNTKSEQEIQAMFYHESGAWLMAM